MFGYLGESREQVEGNLEKLKCALECRRIKVSRSKTEYMSVNESKASGKIKVQRVEAVKLV